MNNYGNGEGFYSKDQYEMSGKFIKIFKDKKRIKTIYLTK